MNESLPSPTGKIFIGFAERFKKRNPQATAIPEKLQDQWWKRAAEKTDNEKLAEALENAHKAKTGH